MEAPPSPHSSAVSGLMQQLKSGEITKMQLFQQIAKLQAASAAAKAAAASANGPSQPPQSRKPVGISPVTIDVATMRAPTAAYNPMSTFSTTMSAPQGVYSTPFGAISESFAPPPPPQFVPSTSMYSQQLHQPPPAVHSTFTTPSNRPTMTASLQDTTSSLAPSSFAGTHRIGATAAPVVKSDAEFLASGVSHDKAPRFSVQEWMATKNRAASLATESNRTAASNATTAAGLASDAALHAASFFPPSVPHEQQRFDEPLFQNYQSTDSLGCGVTAQISASPSPQLFAFATQQQQQQQPPLFQSDDSIAASHAVPQMISETPFTNAIDRDDQYEYNPPRELHSQQQMRSNGSRASSEHEFIDFTDHFRDDLDSGDNSASHRHHRMHKTSNATGGNHNGASSSENGAFHARVTRWKSQKDAIREQMKQQLLQSELDECTFAPKVNPKSTKVAAKLRNRHGGLNDAAVVSPLAVSERLYQEADNYKAREELAQRIKAEEEADLERECTFKPRINRTTALTDKVKAKYMDTPTVPSPSLTAAAMESTAKELEQCTFNPKVNAISAAMVSAQLYLQQDIYERLSRPCAMTAADSPGAATQRLRRRAGSLTDDDMRCDDADSDGTNSVVSPRRTQDDLYIRSRSPRRRRLQTASSDGNNKRQQHQRPRSAGGIVTDDDKNERARQLSNFLERQHFHEEARRKKIATTTQQLQAAHKPTINKKSLNMMENGRKGDFLERITKYALRKEHTTVKNKCVRVSDPNCTFKPSINQTSTKRKGRTVTELSRGDLLRRETTQRLMKLKMEQEEMAALTFRPQLNRVSERHEGKLKILTSPDTYLERIQQQSHAHTIKQRRAVQEKEMEEFAECTFKPRTIEAPAYIQRIARSVSLTKALKQQQLTATRASDKPEWK